MLHLPYGEPLFQLEETGAAVLTSRVDQLTGEGDGAQLVREAMENPIGSLRLRELARGKKTCTLIVSDHTRPVPSRDILPPMLHELREGNPHIDVTLLVATGLHRGTTRRELAEKLGEELAARERIVVHDCADTSANVRIGDAALGRAAGDRQATRRRPTCWWRRGSSNRTSSRLLGRAQERAARGVRPGHRAGQPLQPLIDSPCARTGILDGNPLHIDMLAAARMAAPLLSSTSSSTRESARWRPSRAISSSPTAGACDFLLDYCVVKRSTRTLW
jgi:hypothetical protein